MKNFSFVPFFVSQQPERISGEQYGIHADVWSVGISFMEVVLLHVIALNSLTFAPALVTNMGVDGVLD